MEKRKKIIYSIFTSMVCFGGFLFLWRNAIVADSLDSVVISEVQVSGESANDEFIELYNPTTEEIDLEGWDIKKKTKTGTVSNIVTNITGIIPASGYFLIVPRANCGEEKNEACYKGEAIADGSYTTNNFLAKDNSLLVSDKDDNLIDLVGWGEVSGFEGEVFGINPEDGQSLERKREGGILLDSNDNKNDLFIQDIPNPQSSKVSFGDVNSEKNNDSQGTGNNNQGNETNASSGQGSSSSSAPQEDTFSKMIITEFLPDPEDSDRDSEFIEVYNGGLKEEDLKGWTIEDRSGKIVTFTIPEKTIVKAGEYKEFYSDETKISLNNAGDGAVLKNTKGVIVSEAPICDAAEEETSFALDDNNSWKWTKRPTPGRKNIIVYDESAEKGISKKPDLEEIEAGEIKGNEKVSDKAEKYDFSDKIMISEIFPNPAGMDNKLSYEWVEIYNNADEDINLRGWQIDDILGKGSKSYIIKEDRIIKKGTSLILSSEETKIAFNNSEDEASLIWPDGTIVDSVKYAKTKEGQSYAIFEDGKWIWTSTPTPGEKNIMKSGKENYAGVADEKMAEEGSIEEEDGNESLQEAEIEEEAKNEATSYIEIDVEGAKKMPRFSNVRIMGIVSTPPGIFSDNSFYISGSGMQIYSYKEKISGINIGDKIEASGSVSEIGGEKRLLVEGIESIKVLSHDNLLEAKMISTGDVGERYEGYLVAIEGMVSGVGADVFYIDDGTGEAKVYIKPQTGIIRPEIRTNDPMVITGEVSRTSVGYRILPRFQGDVKTGKTSSISTEEISSQETETLQKAEFPNGEGKVKFPIYGYIFAIAGFLVLVDWGRMKIKK